jgi:aminomethyltransferase
MVDFAGWQLPVQYTGVIEEHRAVRTRVGLFDVSHMGEIHVSGPGAEAFLQQNTPNNVRRLKVGRAHYSGLMTAAGTYVDDLLVYRLGELEFLLVVNAANRERDFATLLERAGEGVELHDHSDDYALLALQGPRAEAVLTQLTDEPVAELRYYGFLQGSLLGAEALISRTGYTGEDGFELYLPPPRAEAVWEALLAAGVAEGLAPAGLGARDTLRLEAAMALYGHELDEKTTPLEAGLGWVVKLKKGDFVGRDVLAEQKASGLARKLSGFEIVDRGIAREGHEVLHEGSVVSEVTSGVWSPTLEKAIGMTYLPPELGEPGTALEIQVRKRRLAAVVVELPFYRTLGITDFAQEELGEVVYVELPEVGQSFDAHEEIGSIESVKAVAEVYTPVAGEVVEVNGALEETPELVNSNPHDSGWLVKFKISGGGPEGLMSAEEYQQFAEGEGG